MGQLILVRVTYEN